MLLDPELPGMETDPEYGEKVFPRHALRNHFHRMVCDGLSEVQNKAELECFYGLHYPTLEGMRKGSDFDLMTFQDIEARYQASLCRLDEDERRFLEMQRQFNFIQDEI